MNHRTFPKKPRIRGKATHTPLVPLSRSCFDISFWFDPQPNQYPGTYWYHSHHGPQRSKGIFGPLIVLDKQSDTLPHNERVLVLQDWYHDTPFDPRERKMSYIKQHGRGGNMVRCLSCFGVSSALIILMGGDGAQLVEHRTGTPLTQVRFPGAARDFSPRINFQCRLSYRCPCTPVYNCMH